MDEGESEDAIEGDPVDALEKDGPEGLLVVRRPVKDGVEEVEVGSLVEADGRSGGEEKAQPSSKIDKGLSEFAKKMPMFEPERIVGSGKRPLRINLELGLYRAKVLTRNFQFKEAEEILFEVLLMFCFFSSFLIGGSILSRLELTGVITIDNIIGIFYIYFPAY